MAEELPIKDLFSVDLQWPANPGAGGNWLLDQSLARLRIMVADKAVTAYASENRDRSTHLTVPTYYLVEWLALNWWAFLYEPRKLDSEAAEHDFRSRHWLGIPRNGFPLPDVIFSPSGEKIEVAARSIFLRFAQITFTESVTASVETQKVRSAFASLIDHVLERLREKGVKHCAAFEAWDRVKATSVEEEAYCRLIGSLGLSPYVQHREVDDALDAIAAKISDTMLIDLCDAANLGSFVRAVELTTGISEALIKAKSVDLRDLLKAPKPADLTSKAYEWGYRATDAARRTLGIVNDDPNGSNAFFDRLKLDPNDDSNVSSEGSAITQILGAVARQDDEMRVSVMGANGGQRKFAAARAAFLAWSDTKTSSRLVTTARTRDQQASRAFAAELLAPAKYLKKRLGDRSEVSSFALDKISEEMGIASTVVRYQAKNHGYYVAEAA
jgi:hypothetical protein